MQDNDDDNKIKTFGIDRISGIKKINKKFQYPKNFNLQDYFKHSLGFIPVKENRKKSFYRLTKYKVDILKLHRYIIRKNTY